MNKKTDMKQKLKFEIIFFATSIILSMINFTNNFENKYLLLILSIILVAFKIVFYFLYEKTEKENNISFLESIQKYNNILNIIFIIAMIFIIVKLVVSYSNNIDIKDKDQVSAILITIGVIVLIIISSLISSKILLKYIFKKGLKETPEKYPIFVLLNIILGFVIFLILILLVLLLLPYFGIRIFHWYNFKIGYICNFEFVPDFKMKKLKKYYSIIEFHILKMA